MPPGPPPCVFELGRCMFEVMDTLSLRGDFATSTSPALGLRHMSRFNSFLPRERKGACFTLKRTKHFSLRGKSHKSTSPLTRRQNQGRDLEVNRFLLLLCVAGETAMRQRKWRVLAASNSQAKSIFGCRSKSLFADLRGL